MIDNILKWTACVVTLAAALCTANEIHTVNRELFAAGAVLYLLWAIRIKELNLIVINAALLIIYGTGLLNG